MAAEQTCRATASAGQGRKLEGRVEGSVEITELLPVPAGVGGGSVIPRRGGKKHAGDSLLPTLISPSHPPL